VLTFRISRYILTTLHLLIWYQHSQNSKNILQDFSTVVICYTFRIVYDASELGALC